MKPFYFRIFLMLITVGLICLSPAEVSAGGSDLIVMVKSRDLSPYNSAVERIRSLLHKTNPTLDFDILDFSENSSTEAEFIERIKRQEPLLVIAIGSEAAGGFSRHDAGVNVIQSMVYEPVEPMLGGTPAERTFGVFLKIPWQRRLHLLKAVLPQFKTISILCRAEDDEVKMIQELGKAMRIEIRCIPASSPKEFVQGLKESSGKTAIHMMRLDSEIYNKAVIEDVLLFSARKKYPVLAISSNYVRAGAFLSFESSYESNASETALLAAGISDGQAIPARFRATPDITLTINKSVANLLGIRVEAGSDFSTVEYV